MKISQHGQYALCACLAAAVSMTAAWGAISEPEDETQRRGRAYALYVDALDAAASGRLSEAHERLRAVLEIDPRAASVRAALARVCLEQGDTVCAESEAQRAMASPAAAGEAHKVLAELALRRYSGSREEGRLQEAIGHLRQATEVAPSDPWAWNVWIRILIRGEQIAAAEDVARRAAAVPGADPDMPWQTLARGLIELDRQDEAIAVIERLEGEGRQIGSLLELKAQLMEQQGNMKGYIEALRELRRLRPGDAEIAYKLGRALLGQGEPYLALEPLRAAHRGRPGDPTVRRDLAVALVELGRGGEALELLENLPNVYRSAHTLFQMARAAEQGSQWAQAAEHLESLLSALSEEDREAYGEAFVRRAAENALRAANFEDVLRLTTPLARDAAILRLRLRALDGLGRHDEADAVLADVRTARPEDSAVLALAVERRLEAPEGGAGSVGGILADLGVADLDREQAVRVAGGLAAWGHGDAAATLLDGLRRPDTCEPRWLRAAASVYYRARRLEQAEALYRAALECSPGDHGVMNDLCYLLADEFNRVDEALPLCRQAVELQPDESSYLDSLGWALHLAGESEEALGWLQRAVANSHEGVRGDIREHLGDVYASLGRTERAVAEWRAALVLVEDEERGRIEKKIRRAVGAGEKTR